MNTFTEIPATAASISRRKLVQGVGKNDAAYLVQPVINGTLQKCPFYAKWVNMLKRAYSVKYHAKQPTYAGVTVCPEWHVFSAFKGWMRPLDWQGMSLDKDLLFPGNKIYGPGTCVFVDSKTNNVLLDSAATRGRDPVGVSFVKRLGKFRAYCRTVDGKRQHIGCFLTAEQAHSAYCGFKAQVILDVARDQPDPRVRDALLKRAAILQGAPA